MIQEAKSKSNETSKRQRSAPNEAEKITFEAETTPKGSISHNQQNQ